MSTLIPCSNARHPTTRNRGQDLIECYYEKSGFVGDITTGVTIHRDINLVLGSDLELFTTPKSRNL